MLQVTLGETTIVELLPNLTEQEIESRGMDERLDAFGQLVRLMQRPKPSEIVISRQQKRYEPFWYGIAQATYRYDRRRVQQVNVGPEVESVTVYGQDLPVRRDAGPQGTFALETIEHSVEQFRRYVMLDAETGEPREYNKYLTFQANPVPDLDALGAEGVVVVQPEIRSSFVVGKLVQASMRTVQADTVHEELIDLEHVGLYFRPVYAYEYHWTTRDKRTVVEFDPLLGTFKAEGGQFKKGVAKVLANDALFDIGADAIGTVIPGANLAVKIGRLAAQKAIE
jgi:hypothetical protein